MAKAAALPSSILYPPSSFGKSKICSRCWINMGHSPMKDRQPLNYQRKSNRKRGPLWLIFFAAFAYAIGAFLCYGKTFEDMFGIIELVTIIVVAVAAIVLG